MQAFVSLYLSKPKMTPEIAAVEALLNALATKVYLSDRKIHSNIPVIA